MHGLLDPSSNTVVTVKGASKIVPGAMKDKPQNVFVKVIARRAAVSGRVVALLRYFFLH